jgi:peptide chain release factor 1
VFDRVAALVSEHALVEAELSDPDVIGDAKRYRVVAKRYSDLTPLVSAWQRRVERLGDLDVAKELFAASDGDEREAMRAEIAAAERDIEQVEEELRTLLLPKDQNDGRNVIVEIRGAEGGEEANLFARDLYEMYRGFATRRGLKVEVLGEDVSALGGLNQVTFMVTGDEAWTRFKYEGGPHRVQRVPVTESQGRVHTSSATVMVLPEADEVDVSIDASDLQVDVYRSSGAGGQSVNTTDSAVRITHLPTGVVVTMQDERSQIQNRARAMAVLRSRLLQLQQETQEAEQSAARRSQVGGGGRSEKIRTYNYKENRITDHRIGLTLYQLQNVLSGDLDPVVDALAADERTRQLADYTD